MYLHDPRCICKEAKTKTRRKNKEDVVLDALFWPVMPYPMVAAKLDMNRQPHVIQSYSVPTPQHDQYHRHDTAVFSLWMHFVDFCMANADSSSARIADAATCYCAPDAAINGYTEEPRLHIFRYLSSCNGRDVSREEFAKTTASVIPAFARNVLIPKSHIALAHNEGGSGNSNYYNNSSPATGVYDANRSGIYPSATRPMPPVSSASMGGQNNERETYIQKEFGDRLPFVRRSSHTSSLSSSPVTVASERSPQRYVPVQRPAFSAPLSPSEPAVPTSLSLLMTSVPQNAVHGADMGKKLDLQSSPMDPWALDGFGGYTDDERDSGSSFNSIPMQNDFHSIWKNDSSSFYSTSSARDTNVHEFRNSNRL